MGKQIENIASTSKTGKEDAPKKRKDKRRRGHIKIGEDAKGNPIYKYPSARTKDLLEKKKEEIRRTYINGNEVGIDRDILFITYAQQWFIVYKLPKVREATKANYNTAFTKHLLPAFGHRQMRAITAYELQIFLNGKAGFGKTTLTLLRSILRNMFTMAMSSGIIDRNPSVGLILPAADEEPRRELTDEETAAVLVWGRDTRKGCCCSFSIFLVSARGKRRASSGVT